MPKRTDIHKILVIGSGPIVIGQAAEFDYSGTQACLALREEGYEVVLINSNPASLGTAPGSRNPRGTNIATFPARFTTPSFAKWECSENNRRQNRRMVANGIRFSLVPTCSQ